MRLLQRRKCSQNDETSVTLPKQQKQLVVYLQLSLAQQDCRINWFYSTVKSSMQHVARTAYCLCRYIFVGGSNVVPTPSAERCRPVKPQSLYASHWSSLESLPWSRSTNIFYSLSTCSFYWVVRKSLGTSCYTLHNSISCKCKCKNCSIIRSNMFPYCRYPGLLLSDRKEAICCAAHSTSTSSFETTN